MLTIPSASENGEPLHLLQVPGRSENGTVILEKGWESLKTKHATQLPYDRDIVLLGIHPVEVKMYPHKSLQTNAHSSSITGKILVRENVFSG